MRPNSFPGGVAAMHTLAYDGTALVIDGARTYADLAAVNQQLASWESVKYVRILPTDFSTETGELTPSLKVKRKVVTERFRNLIDQMYD